MTIKIIPSTPPSPADPDEIADAVKILMAHGYFRLLMNHSDGSILLRKYPEEKKCSCGVDNDPSCN